AAPRASSAFGHCPSDSVCAVGASSATEAVSPAVASLETLPVIAGVRLGTRGASAKSSFIELAPATRKIPPQTEHRARTPTSGTLTGSTRKTLRHSGQLTFINPLQAAQSRA